MLKAIKIQIYPNQKQASYINNLLGCCRFVYNKCLALKIERYNTNKESLGMKELSKYITDLKHTEDFNWLSNVHSKVLQQSLINLNDAYKRFFVNHTGFPKFKSKHECKQSCRFPIDAISGIKNNKINLIKQLKNITFRCSDRDISTLNKENTIIKSLTLTKTKINKCYCSILIDTNQINKTLIKNNNIIGLDLGIKTFIVDSDGNEYENIRSIKNNEKQLKKLQKQLSKKKTNSKNKEKSRIKLARKHEKIRNIKINYLHNLSSAIVKENQIIIIEYLNISGMLKNHNLAKSIQELSLYEFRRQLEYKSKWYGRDLVVIDKWFPSSKLCSNCGYKYNELNLNEREWKCKNCGIVHDRDFNAAINIKNEGKRIFEIKENKIGWRTPEFTLEDCPTTDGICASDSIVLKSSDRLIQEELR